MNSDPPTIDSDELSKCSILDSYSINIDKTYVSHGITIICSKIDTIFTFCLKDENTHENVLKNWAMKSNDS